MKKNTMLETAVERRNLYQNRVIDNAVNVIYFTRLAEESKPDTQEKVDAIAELEKSTKDCKNDKKLMEAFDILIEQLEKEGK